MMTTINDRGLPMPSKQYQWDEWFTYPGFILFRGKDYSCSQSSMVQQIRNEATRRGIRVSITEDYDQIITVVRGDDDAEAIAATTEHLRSSGNVWGSGEGSTQTAG